MCSIATEKEKYSWCQSSFLDVDECVNHTCGNGGSCVDGVNNYSCSCKPGFTGDSCQTGVFFRYYQRSLSFIALPSILCRFAL